MSIVVEVTAAVVVALEVLLLRLQLLSVVVVVFVVVVIKVVQVAQQLRVTRCWRKSVCYRCLHRRRIRNVAEDLLAAVALAAVVVVD